MDAVGASRFGIAYDVWDGDVLAARARTAATPFDLTGGGLRRLRPAEREVLAAALRELRPGLEVIELTPDRLDGALAALRPSLVVCGAASAAVRARAPAWVLLYPEGAGHAVVCLGGEERVVPAFDLADLVVVLDAAARRPGDASECPAPSPRAGVSKPDEQR